MKRTRLQKIGILSAAMLGLATLSFNCAPNMFESVKYMGTGSNSASGTFDKPLSPYAMLTATQTLQSMLNVTGLSGVTPSASQQSEFNQRANSLAGTDSLTTINGPLLLAATSLAGEVCNGVIAKELAMAPTGRTFFSAVDFTKPVSAGGPDQFNIVASNFAQSFYGRDLSGDEGQILASFYNDFVSGLSAAQVSSPAQTQNLYLSLCSAMLSSFDSLTY